MRIGIDAGLLLLPRYTGIEGYLAELATRLPRLAGRHEVRLCFNYNRPRHRRTVERFTRAGARARVCRIPPQLLWPMHWHLGLPVDWIYGRMDVMLYPSFVTLPLRQGQIVVTVHDLFPLTHPELYPAEDVEEFRALVPRSLARADAVIVVSAYTGQVVQERFGLAAARVHCVHNGVDERFSPPTDPEAAVAVARRYGIAGPYFLFVGTREPRKNLVRLVEAFGRAAQGALREYTLVLAGQPAWGEAALRQALARLASGVRVLLLGYVAREDLPALYGAATAFLFPSLVEGFGIPPLEAMASGCPVLTSTAPALPEVVGDAALTVAPTDVEALADGIRRLGEDAALRAHLRARGLRRAKEFSWDRTAAETLAVLEGVGA
jgi:alpha-1,3-rhamnosyl/mannosyltransferase